MIWILLGATIISTGICFSVAKRKGLSVPSWVVLAALIGPLAIPFVYLAKDKHLQSNA